ncbi:MAG: hypothetical protein WB037_25220 [Pseudolabrys sp.]
MTFHRDDPNTWPCFNPLIIAHDVGRSRDRSTAVIGGNGPFQPRLLGIRELHELPQRLFGSARASALAKIDRYYNSNALIVADLSNDRTYAEVLFEMFGARVIGVQISRYGDGMTFERLPVKHSAMSIYTVGRTYLIELLHTEMQNDQVRFVDGPMSKRAYEQLMGLETEMRESGTVYSCPSGHDDLGISCAMLAWAARHPHLREWVRISEQSRRTRKPRPTVSWAAFT